MKTFLRLYFFLSASILFTGCSESSGIIDQTIPSKILLENSDQTKTRSLKVEDLTFEEVKRYLDQCGYNTTNLTEYEDYYLIDSDMGFYKERLAEEIAQTAPRMVFTSLLNKEHYRININFTPYEFTDSQIFNDAINEWNNINNCCLNFTSSNFNNGNPKRWQVDLTIQPDPYGPGAYPNMIFVEAPTKGIPGTKIIINTNSKLWKKIDATQRKYAIMHAIGHLVGLGHYDFFGNHYQNTVADPSTIMQDERGLNQNNTMWQGFTGHDINALVEMYHLEPATHKITCQPEITGSDKTKMVIGTEYTLTASYDYDWVFNPTYTYEVIRGKEFVTTSVKDNSLKLKFTKGGSCKIRITANDALGEKDPDGNAYTFDAEYHAYPDKPTFTYPSSIRMGEFCTFKMALDNPEYKNITYTYSVKEVLFDNNTARSATIEQDGKGTARIRFNDYGKYYVTAKAVYGGKSAEFTFLYTHLYRPEPEIFPMLVEPGPNFGSAGIPEFTTEPTGENLIGIYRMRIRFDKAALMPHRIVCQVTGDRRQQFWQSPGRVDYRIIDYCTEQRQVILTEADSAYVDLSDERSYFHPDSVNYKEHRTVIYPYATAKYTEEDWCGLVNTTYSNAE